MKQSRRDAPQMLPEEFVNRMDNVTRTLARFIVSSRYEDIPQAIRHEASRALINWLGCAIGSSHHETIECMLAALKPFAGAEQASVVGRKDRLDILNAAFVNGVASHVLDFDDTHAALRMSRDRKSTRLNSSHGYISYAVFCLKKKKNEQSTRLHE